MLSFNPDEFERSEMKVNRFEGCPLSMVEYSLFALYYFKAVHSCSTMRVS